MNLFLRTLESLDLSDEKQRAIRNFITCTHDELCMWRAVTGRRIDGQIFEVVEFVSPKRAASALPRFGVVTWDLKKPAVRWQHENLTRAQAMQRFGLIEDGATVIMTDEIEIPINLQNKIKRAINSDENPKHRFTRLARPQSGPKAPR